jgi:hypothetical protein
MSRPVGDALPNSLFERLSGRDLEAISDRVIVVCTVDDRGYPHPALLSYLETIAVDRRTIRLAMYSSSRSTQYARREGRLTLILVDDRVAYYVKGTVQELARSMAVAPHNTKLQLHVAEVLADEADPELEPGAYIASGLTYVNPRRAGALEQARQLLAALAE